MGGVGGCCLPPPTWEESGQVCLLQRRRRQVLKKHYINKVFDFIWHHFVYYLCQGFVANSIGKEMMTMRKDAVTPPNLSCRNGNWHADFVDPMGRRVRVSLRTNDRKLAEIKLKKMQVIAYEKGNFEMKKPARILFRDLAPKVLDYQRDRKRCFSKIYLPVMKHLVKFFGSRYLHEITVNQINAYQTHRKEFVEPITVNKEVSILSRCFSLAIKWGLAQSNPVAGVEHFRIPKTRIRFLTLEEISRFLQSCDGYIWEVLLTALHTGGRKSEILGLRWENIDFENRLVVFERTKNDEVRQVPMTDAMYQMLSDKRNESTINEFVFVGKDGEPFGNVNKAFKSALRAAGIENFRLHDCRHTYASQLVMAGVDILTIKELLGHKDLKTTLIYAHLAPKHKIEAVKTYERHLGQVISLRHKLDTNAVCRSAV